MFHPSPSLLLGEEKFVRGDKKNNNNNKKQLHLNAWGTKQLVPFTCLKAELHYLRVWAWGRKSAFRGHKANAPFMTDLKRKRQSSAFREKKKKKKRKQGSKSLHFIYFGKHPFKGV